jgi:L-asparaginase / beta-aspartyl-peptidase
MIQLFAFAFALLLGCGAPDPRPTSPRRATPARAPYVLVVHGGAGGLAPGGDAGARRAYVEALAHVLGDGCRALDEGRSSLDVVEAAVVAMEDDSHFNAGRGAVATSAGTHELDASIMDGRNHACGAVAAVRTVKNPIALARAVMQQTPHVLLVADGAEAFARELGMPPIDETYFAARDREPRAYGTVGAVALDRDGHLAAATSTGGLTGKRPGRVGDSPIIGAGTYADDRTCAVSATGTGEEFIRHGVARAIAARMEIAGESAERAAAHLVQRTLRPNDGGVIVVSRLGEVAMPYTTRAMIRGRCGPGEIEVRIWEEAEELPP